MQVTHTAVTKIDCHLQAYSTHLTINGLLRAKSVCALVLNFSQPMRASTTLWCQPVFELVDASVHRTLAVKWVRIPRPKPIKNPTPYGVGFLLAEDEGFELHGIIP